MLHELIYRSLSHSEMPVDELESLLRKSKENNRKIGITGMLLYHNGEFMQILEGEKSVVGELYAKIVADPRHYRVHVVWEGPIEERGFKDWTMGFADTRSDKVNLLEGHTQFLENGELTAASEHPTVCKQILVHLRDTLLIGPTIPEE